MDAFQKALDEGEARVRRVPVMLIGQERAGKTSLKKSLKGDKFDPDEARTRGVDIDPSLFKVTTDMWKAGTAGSSDEDIADAVSFEFHAAKLTLKHLKAANESAGWTSLSEYDDALEEKSATSPEEEHSNSEGKTREEKSTMDNASKAPEPKAEGSIQGISKAQGSLIDAPAESDDRLGNEAREELETHQVKAEMPDEIAKLIATLLQKKEAVEEDEEAVYCTLWDFAGQSVFYATHSLFLTRRAIYLLVNDLSKPPHQEADLKSS